MLFMCFGAQNIQVIIFYVKSNFSKEIIKMDKDVIKVDETIFIRSKPKTSSFSLKISDLNLETEERVVTTEIFDDI